MSNKPSSSHQNLQPPARVLHSIERAGDVTLPLPGTPVVDPEAARIIAAARDAEAQARARAAELQAAQTAAIEDALKRGIAQGRQEMQRELASAFMAMAKAGTGFQAEAESMKRAVDDFATALALGIAARIIGREIKDAETVRTLLAHALSHVPARKQLVIKMNPADVALLTGLRGRELAPEVTLPDDATLVGDAMLTRGGCLIESSTGNIDARIETQLALIERALRGEGK